jgi:hypothetical protein
MLAILCLLTTFAANLFRSRRQLEVENLFLRHQLNIALRGAPRRLRSHSAITPLAGATKRRQLETGGARGRSKAVRHPQTGSLGSLQESEGTKERLE